MATAAITDGGIHGGGKGKDDGGDKRNEFLVFENFERITFNFFRNNEPDFWKFWNKDNSTKHAFISVSIICIWK